MKKNYLLRLLLSALACWALLASGAAQAAMTCNLTSNGFTTSYSPANTTATIVSASFTMTCTRSASGDALSQTYTVAANTGLNPAGGGLQAASGSNRISYDLDTGSGCNANRWKGGTKLGGTITFTSTSDFTPRTSTVSYWGCIGSGQNVAAGTYTDTVTMTPSIGTTATFPVTIVTSASCSISSPPGTMTFNYTSLQSGAASASTSFSNTCSNSLPYTMALDATSGTLIGLNYTLSLSASSATGTGAAQSHTINGSVAAGQTGICSLSSCSATAARTLTITY